MATDDHRPVDDTENEFESSPITRRDFARLSAATAGILTLPGAALAEVSSSKMTEEYQYVVNHTPEDEPIPTLIEFSDQSGFDELGTLDVETKTTEESTTAAYAQLTTGQVNDVLSISSATELAFSPGANPFWQLDQYSEGIFPEVSNSPDYIDFEEMIQGLEYLQESYSDQLQFYSIGQSPGYFDSVEQEEDPKEMWVAEVTNDIDDEDSFEEKEKVAFSLSIHGDERAGAEAGTRFIEDLLRGDESAVEDLLDELVLIFFYPNPDGWVARYPQYNDDGEGYQRGTAGVEDPNRSYPTVGWIDGTHYPAESNGSNLEDDHPEIDSDVASQYTERVPGSLAVVEHFRDYNNLNYGSDLHEKGPSEDFIEGLLINDQFTVEELHDLYEFNRTTDERLDEDLASVVGEDQDLFERLNEDLEEIYREQYNTDEDIPEPDSVYDYGTVYDTLEYSTTGILVSWMAQPESQGGLGMKAQAHEVSSYDELGFVSEFVELQVIGYKTVIRTLAEHAAKNVEAKLDTDDRSTAVVTTESLTRSSDQLEFVEQSELDVTEAGEETVLTGSVLSENEDRTVATPDPEALLEFEQRAYETSPFEFFEDAAEYIADDQAGFAEITPERVRDGELLEGGNGQLAYDNLVVIHDEGIDDDSYLDAVDEFVEQGGNLVLTDSGVNLLASLENDLSADVTADDITTETVMFPIFAEDNYPNRLLDDTRPYQDELWKLAPLGYAITEDGEAPVTLVDPDAFGSAGGEVAATTEEMVAAGSLLADEDAGTGIYVVGSLLPPASQVHLHPFGMVNYTVSFFGSLVATNALGYRQERYVDGELVHTFGPEAGNGES